MTAAVFLAFGLALAGAEPGWSPGPAIEPGGVGLTWFEERVDADHPCCERRFRVVDGDLAGPRGRLRILLDGARPNWSPPEWWTMSPPALSWRAAGPIELEAQATAAETAELGPVALLRLKLAARTDTQAELSIGFVTDAGYPARFPPVAPGGEYALLDAVAVGNGQVLYQFPRAPAMVREARLGRPYDGPFRRSALDLGPTDPLGLVRYPVRLGPRQAAALVFRLPSEPLPPDRAEAAARLDFDQTMLRERDRWAAYQNAQPALELGEARLDRLLAAAAVRLRAWEGWRPPELIGAEALLSAHLTDGLVVRETGAGRLLHVALSLRRGRVLLRRRRGREAAEALVAVAGLADESGALPDAVAAGVVRYPFNRWGQPAERDNLSELLALAAELLALPEDDGLTLLAGVPADWLGPGRRLSARRLPTPYGPVDLTVQAGDDALRVDLPTAPAGPARVAVPAGFDGARATADGRPCPMAGDRLVVPAGAAVLILPRGEAG